MRPLALVVGHRIDVPGAKNPKTPINEYMFNYHLACGIMHFNRLSYQLPIRMVIRRRSLEDVVRYVNDLEARACISLHCNAFFGKGTGSEVLYWHTSKIGKQIAEYLLDQIGLALQLKIRGAKPIQQGQRGSFLLRYTKCPCVIAEPFFIDNDQDLKVAYENYPKLIKAYLEGFRYAYEITSD